MLKAKMKCATDHRPGLARNGARSGRGDLLRSNSGMNCGSGVRNRRCWRSRRRISGNRSVPVIGQYAIAFEDYSDVLGGVIAQTDPR